MATGDKLVNLEDLKAVYDNVAATESALDSRVNAVHCMVDYWGADFSNSTGSVTRYSTRMSINVEFAASTGVNQSKGYRLNGTCTYFANRNALDALTDGIKLKDGHTYRWYYCDEHGTQTRAGGGRAIFAMAYAYGGHSSLGTTGYYGVTEYREFKYTDAAYPNGVQLCALIYTDAVLTFTNWSANFILEDVTYGHITDPNIAPVEAGDTARANHTSGSLLLWNGKLYKATEAIESSGTIAGKVSSATTVAEQLALKADTTALTAEATARAAEDADIYMEPWMLMCKKYCITEGNSAFVVHRNHITFTADSSANAATLRTIVGAFAVRSSTLGNYTPIASELIPVSVFGSAIKMGFYVHSNTAGRNPRLAYKFCTVDGDTVTPVEDGYGTVPGTAANDVISEATVSVPNGATHVFFAITFSSGYYVGTYDMVYKIDKG